MGTALRLPEPHPIVEPRVLEGALLAYRERALCTLNSIGDAVVSTDVTQRVSYLNTVAERLTGWSLAEAAGRPFEEIFLIVDATTRKRVANPMAQAVLEGRTVCVAPDCVLIGRDGVESAIEDSASPIRDDDGVVHGAVMVFRDVSIARAHAQRMQHLVNHDSLTAVANRLLLMDRLTQAVGLAQRESRQAALLFVDVDHFKWFNDTLGHDVGDRLLCSIAQRLLACVRSSDTVSRVGGDEFVILLPEIGHARDGGCAAETILRAFSGPHHIDVHRLEVSLSIGIATFPDDGVDPRLLVTRADQAMYCAKVAGRGGYRFFAESIPALIR